MGAHWFQDVVDRKKCWKFRLDATFPGKVRYKQNKTITPMTPTVVLYFVSRNIPTICFFVQSYVIFCFDGTLLLKC